MASSVTITVGNIAVPSNVVPADYLKTVFNAIGAALLSTSPGGTVIAGTLTLPATPAAPQPPLAPGTKKN